MMHQVRIPIPFILLSHKGGENMPSYNLHPRSYNYVSGYQYNDANHPTEHCMDDDLNTYWSISDYSASHMTRTLYDFDFSVIPNNEIVTDVTVSLRYLNNHSGKVNFRPVSALEKGVTSPTNTIGYKAVAAPKAASVTTYKYSLLDKTTEVIGVVKYLNDNKNALVSGSKIFGLYYESTAPSTSNPVLIYDLSLVIETEVTGSLIYNGSSNITSAYLGNTKLNGIYLGSQKLL